MLFRRGIYQCIKYRAVLDAQILEQSIPVHSLLVTKEELDGELKQLAKRMKVKYLVIYRNNNWSCSPWWTLEHHAARCRATTVKITQDEIRSEPSSGETPS